MSKPSSMNRREFFGALGAALTGLTLIPILKVSTAFANAYAALKSPPPAGKRAADPTTGSGKTQSYVFVAKDYKGPKRPAINPASKCGNCTHYKPAKDVPGPWAPCAVLAQAWVYEEGLCALYMKNPKAT